MTRNERQRANAAIHEAAHAVAAIVLGRRFRAVELFTAENAPPPVVVWTGESGKSRGRLHPEDTRIYWEEIPDNTLMLLAGPAATRRLTHRSWFAIFLGAGAGDYADAVDLADDLPGVGDPPAYVETFRRRATKLVNAPWETILRAAAELKVRG